MGLASALNTALTGLAANETMIDVVGNNIANANTIGFKSSRVLFATQFSRTLSKGGSPSTDTGGTNPRQIGLGTFTAGINVDFSQGTIQASASPSDLAIQGEGFFIVDQNGAQAYTRAGVFSLNAANELVNSQGLRLMGNGVDENFNLVDTVLQPLSIPLGDLVISQATQDVEIEGALTPTGTVASKGSTLQSLALFDSTTGPPNTAVSGATLLTDVLDAAGGNNLFQLSEVLTFTPKKGGRVLESKTLTVGAGTDVGDLLALINDTLGLQSGGAIPGSAGATVNGSGQIVVNGNYGTANDITIDIGDLRSSATGTVALSFNKTQQSNGESAFTQFVVFDSLGIAVDVRLAAVLESVTPTNTIYRFYAESPDDSDSTIALGTGTITFDSQGKVSAVQGNTLSIDRDNVASLSPLQFTLNLDNLGGLAAASSNMRATLQNSSAPGSLTSFLIEETGLIQGVFNNGLTRVLGQVVLARFPNAPGLIHEGDNLFREGPNSGLPIVAAPGGNGNGTLLSGALELSNADVGRNLVDLIVASTNYRGNARVIDAVQELLDNLLLLGR